MTKYVSVPAEPTEAMVEAGLLPWFNKGARKGDAVVRGVYLAMIAASPQPVVGDREAVRQRIAEIVEAAIERHNPGKSLRHTLDDADAILASLASRPEGDQELTTGSAR